LEVLCHFPYVCYADYEVRQFFSIRFIFSYVTFFFISFFWEDAWAIVRWRLPISKFHITYSSCKYPISIEYLLNYIIKKKQRFVLELESSRTMSKYMRQNPYCLQYYIQQIYKIILNACLELKEYTWFLFIDMLC